MERGAVADSATSERRYTATIVTPRSSGAGWGEYGGMDPSLQTSPWECGALEVSKCEWAR